MWLVGVVSRRWVWLVGVVIRRYIDILIIINTQMVAVALGPWASHSEDRAEP